MAAVATMFPPNSPVRALYVPGSNGDPLWQPMLNPDPEPSGPDWSPMLDPEGNPVGKPVWLTQFEAARDNGSIAFWQGGTWAIDGQLIAFTGQ
ncbi:MAG: hypothetical protein JNM99_08555 [Verrucomicrobiaceae bacterium]|nr:hypothetical protein [Verrucomicrobiaceae bacterium]